ncbi:putative oxalocrotonate tautomerase, partial [Boeremia exigua]|uniref:putative oxalocrotonate tautomerase n=1 Tax=Boeremia exigua TaxID=749465 RepID=UPI001E8E1CAB
MPLWLIFHPDGTFEDDASKEALSTDITKIYTGVGLPAFYVIVNFIKMPGNTMWVGGKKANKEKPFIRLAIEHIAVTLPNQDEVYRNTANRVDEALKPHVADKGYDWEFHIDETERRLWKINGIFPPAHKSEEEKLWAKENRAIPF